MTEQIRALAVMELGEGLPAITMEFGAALAQACAVCFEDQEHTSGVELKVDGTFKESFNVYHCR